MSRLIFCDLETTGLVPDKGLILEIAIVVVDAATLAPVDVYATPIAVDMREALPLCDEKVRTMHTDNGLFRDILAGKGKPLETVRSEATEFIRKQGLDRPPLCGSNPTFDRGWLKRHMSYAAEQFGHRHFDTRTLYYAAQYWHEPTHLAMLEAEQVSAHRALSDIVACIKLVKAFRAGAGWS